MQEKFNKRANIVAGVLVLALFAYVGFIKPYQEHGLGHLSALKDHK